MLVAWIILGTSNHRAKNKVLDNQSSQSEMRVLDASLFPGNGQVLDLGLYPYVRVDMEKTLSIKLSGLLPYLITEMASISVL